MSALPCSGAAGSLLAASRRQPRSAARRGGRVSCAAAPGGGGEQQQKAGGVAPRGAADAAAGSSDGGKRVSERTLGLDLGPIGLSLQQASPIALSLGGAVSERAGRVVDEEDGAQERPRVRLNSLTTEEWQRKYINDDDTISLWVEEDYNAASRLPAGRTYGARENVAWSGKESADADVPTHSVRIKAHDSDEVLSVSAPQDRRGPPTYVLFEAEDQGLTLPSACRMGCCTVCAVKVKSGTITQPQALGLSAGMKAKGYALLCVGFAQSDLEVELQDPDEVYEMQFGRAFEEQATDPNARSVMRDDFALEIALGDE